MEREVQFFARRETEVVNYLGVGGFFFHKAGVRRKRRGDESFQTRV